MSERDAKTDAALQSSSASKYSQLSSFASDFCSGCKNSFKPQTVFFGEPDYWCICSTERIDTKPEAIELETKDQSWHGQGLTGVLSSPFIIRVPFSDLIQETQKEDLCS